MDGVRGRMEANNPLNKERRKPTTLGDLTGAMVSSLQDSPTPIDPHHSLVIQETGDILARNFILSPAGLVMGEGATHDDWLWLGNILKRFSDSVQWWVGDWLNAGAHVWGYTYQAVAEMFQYDPQTIRVWSYVARNVDLLMRINTLSFYTHRLVASLDPEEQDYWLQEAASNEWSTRQLSAAMKADRGEIASGTITVVQSWKRDALAIPRHELIVYLREWLDELEAE